MAALLQFEHGCLLSHLTFLFLHVIHDLVFKPEEAFVAFIAGGVPCFPLVVGGSLGSRLLFELKVGRGNWPVEFVSAGEVEKSLSSKAIGIDL